MRLKLDLHVHTRASQDSLTTLDEAVREAKAKGLHGFALTEHDKPSKIKGFIGDMLIIPGLEERTSIGHVLILGVTCWRFRPGLKPVEVVLDEADRLGAVTVLAHPFPKTLMPLYLSWVTRLGVDAVEVLNSGSLLFPLSSRINRFLASKLNIAITAGSDSHIPRTVGDAYTVVETESSSLDNILNSIEKGRTEVYGAPSGLRAKIEKRLRRKTFDKPSQL